MPCSRNFLTFHIVISAVGEDEMIMIGFDDRAFFARFGSVRQYRSGSGGDELTCDGWWLRFLLCGCLEGLSHRVDLVVHDVLEQEIEILSLGCARGVTAHVHFAAIPRAEDGIAVLQLDFLVTQLACHATIGVASLPSCRTRGPLRLPRTPAWQG